MRQRLRVRRKGVVALLVWDASGDRRRTRDSGWGGRGRDWAGGDKDGMSWTEVARGAALPARKRAAAHDDIGGA